METIGVAGNLSGSGCTHAAISIAGYKAGVCGEKTAYIDYTKKHEIESLALLFEDRLVNKEQGFTLNGIDFYFGLSEQKLLSVWKQHYGCIVFDFGTSWKEKNLQREYARCTRSFLVCDVCDWKKLEFLQDVEQLQELPELSVEYILSGSGWEDHKWVRQKTGIAAYSLGRIADPFQLEKKEVLRLRELFTGKKR